MMNIGSYGGLNTASAYNQNNRFFNPQPFQQASSPVSFAYSSGIQQPQMGGGNLSSMLQQMLSMLMSMFSGFGGGMGGMGGGNYALASSGNGMSFASAGGCGMPSCDVPSTIIGGPRPTYGGGKKGDFWGDPHFSDFDGGKFDVMGENGKIYNIISDQNIQYNAKFVGGDEAGITVIGEAGIQIGNDQVKYAIGGAKPTVNGVEMKEGETVDLGNGAGSATFDGKQLSIKTSEYDIELLDEGGAMRSNVSISDEGPFGDYVMPHGLLGQTADGDGQARNGKTGKGAQGEGAIDGVYTDYEVSDLFAGDFKYNRFGAQVAGVQRGADGQVAEAFDAAGNVIYKKPTAEVGKTAAAE